jgi:hypothetical protein
MAKINNSIRKMKVKGDSVKMVKKEIPILVKIIAVIGYIGAVVFLLLGISLIIGAGAIAALLANSFPIIAGIGAGLFIVVGIVVLALAVLYFFVSRGLWNGKSWARITLIILSSIGILMSIFPFRIIGFTINLAILLYMIMSKEVKIVFK